MADTRPAAGEGSERSGEPKVPAQDQSAHELARLIAESDAKGKGFWRRRKRKAASTTAAAPSPAAPAPTAPAPTVTPEPDESVTAEVTDKSVPQGATTEATAPDTATGLANQPADKSTDSPAAAPTTEKPATEQPTAEKSSTEESSAKKSPTEESSAEGAADGEASAEDDPAEKTSTEKTSTEETSSEKTSAEDSSSEKPSAEESSTEVSSADESSAGESSVEETSVVEAGTNESAAQPAADGAAQPAGQPSTDGPAGSIDAATQQSDEQSRPTVGVVYEPVESADGFPLEYGEIIIGLPKKPGTQDNPSPATADLDPTDDAELPAEQPEAEDTEAEGANAQDADSNADAADASSDAEPAESDPATEVAASAKNSSNEEDTSANGQPNANPVDSDSPDSASDGGSDSLTSETDDAPADGAGSDPDAAAESADSETASASTSSADSQPDGDTGSSTDSESDGDTGSSADSESGGDPGNSTEPEADGDTGGSDGSADSESDRDSGSSADSESDGDSAVDVAAAADSVAGASTGSGSDGISVADSTSEPDANSDGADSSETADGSGEGAGVEVDEDSVVDTDVTAASTNPGERSDEDSTSDDSSLDDTADNDSATSGHSPADGESSADAAEGEPDAAEGDVATDGELPADAADGDSTADSAESASGSGSAESGSDSVDVAGTDSDSADGGSGSGGDGNADSADDGSDSADSDSGSSDAAGVEVVREKSVEEVATEQAAMALITALMKLRGALAASRLPIDVVGADEARQQQKVMLDQLDDYILPRLVQLEAPVLAVVGGSTGAGKSTLVNSLIGQVVSEPGVLRPTTRSPVLIHHPADAEWFAGDRVLPGMARSSGDKPGGTEDPGQIRLVAADTIPQGLAVLDAPDIDSVVEANRDLATQLLAAADLWLFVTTAARYADAVPWEFLQSASDRSTAVAVVLDRAPADTIDDITGHLAQMLLERGLGDSPLFSIKETVVDSNGMLASEVVASIKDWLIDLAADAEARSAVVRRTLQGAVTAMTKKTPAFAKAVRAQADTVVELRTTAETAYERAVKDIAKATQDGTMLRGEVLARWQEFVGTGELLKGLQTNVGRLRDKVRTAVVGKPPPTRDLKDAVESGLESLLREHAEAAAERAEESWQSTAPGRQLLAAGDRDMGRMSKEFPAEAGRAVREWQGYVLDLVRQEGADKRSAARILAYGVNGLGLALMVVIFASTAGIPTGAEVGVGAGTAVVGQKLLEAIFGDQAVRTLAAKARDDLDARVHALMDAEFARYLAVLDQHPVDPDAPRQLIEAARAVEDCT